MIILVSSCFLAWANILHPSVIAQSSALFATLWKMIKHQPSSIIYQVLSNIQRLTVPNKDSPKSFFVSVPNPNFTESEEISIIVSLHEHSIQPIINVYLTLRIDAKIFPENDLKPKPSCMSNKEGYHRRQLLHRVDMIESSLSFLCSYIIILCIGYYDPKKLKAKIENFLDDMKNVKIFFICFCPSFMYIVSER